MRWLEIRLWIFLSCILMCATKLIGKGAKGPWLLPLKKTGVTVPRLLSAWAVTYSVFLLHDLARLASHWLCPIVWKLSTDSAPSLPCKLYIRCCIILLIKLLNEFAWQEPSDYARLLASNFLLYLLVPGPPSLHLLFRILFLWLWVRNIYISKNRNSICVPSAYHSVAEFLFKCLLQCECYPIVYKFL